MFGRGRAEPRLDPVRWSRPGRGTSIRFAAVAVLLAVAAAVAWSRTPGCAPPGPIPAAAPADASGTHTGTDAAVPSGGSTNGSATSSTSGSTLGTITGSSTTGSRRHSGNPASARPALPAGTVGVPVRLAEPAALALVQVGDRVDLLSIASGSGNGSGNAPATPVADSATVLAVSGTDDPTTGGLLLALRPAEARQVVGASDHARFAVLIRPDT